MTVEQRAKEKPKADPHCAYCKGRGVITEDTHQSDNGPGATRYIISQCQCVR